MTDRIGGPTDTGLRFRITVEEAGQSRVLHDSLGAMGVSEETVEWTLGDGATLRASFAPANGPKDHAMRDLIGALGPSIVRMERELGFFQRELSARYGEVELLTSAAETLGAGMMLDRGSARVLADLAAVLEADVAELWTADDEAERLVRFASSAPDAARAVVDLTLNRGPLPSAWRSATTHATDDERGSMLLVPVPRSVVHGLAGALGVVRVRRPSGRSFTPAERRLVAAIAGQLGAAFENQRLAEESLERERMMVELELAHHLQLKLLPDVADFADCADIAARCEPAESVGGDFYNLFRLGNDRIGVMLGDVSSHGYSAGLIMALTMSAASLLVQERVSPSGVLRGIHEELVRKLERTERYMTLCYAELDPRSGLLRYANAGHPHAFRIGPDTSDRLDALNPPLGIAEFDRYDEREIAWTSGRDTLLMFTDGLGETMQPDRLWSDDLIVETVRRFGAAPACDLIDGLFTIAAADGTPAPDDRTALALK